MLQVRTAPKGDTLGEDFTVIRPRRRLMRQSYAGLIYTRRSTRDSLLPVRQTIGADFELATSRFRGSQNLQFSGFYTRTPTPPRAPPAAMTRSTGCRLNYPNDLWNARMSYRVVEKNADPAVGFIERTDYRRWNPVVRFGPRPGDHRFIRQVSTETWAELLTDTSNELLGRALRVTLVDVGLHSGDSASVTVNPIYERLERNFRIGGITLPVGSTYQYTRYSANITTATRRTLSAIANVQAGTFYSGHRRDVSASVTVRPRPGVLATLTAQQNRVELPGSRFTTRILRALVNTQFGPFVSLANNLQYRLGQPAARVAGPLPLDSHARQRHLFRRPEQLAGRRRSLSRARQQHVHQARVHAAVLNTSTAEIAESACVRQAHHERSS